MNRPAARAVVVGFNARLLQALQDSGRYRVVVVEEPDLIAAKSVPRQLAGFGCVDGLVDVRYQQSGEAVGAVPAAVARPEAVIPGQEYAVPATARLAEAWGLPGAGPAAADLLRDKLELRRATTAADLAAPPWREARSASDVAGFLAEYGPAVLKPANRQASVGVALLSPGDDVAAAWQACTGADEPTQVARRPMHWRFIVEGRLGGDEFSTEALVQDGHPLFFNVTRKHLLPGRHPVETGHDVPAPVGPETVAALRRATEGLLAATGFRTGIVHAEWKVAAAAAGPACTLIECAGRTPGDMILRLVELAYGFNAYLALADLLRGETPSLPARAGRAASIRFLTTSAPGRLISVQGVGAAAGLPGVDDARVLAAPGQLLGPVTSSWDRLGAVIASGATAAEAAARAEAALGSLDPVVAVRESA